MRVFEINTDSGCGSTGRIASDIARECMKEGNECLIAYGRDFYDTGVPILKMESAFEIYCHGIKSRVLDRHGFGSKNATLNLIKRIDEYKPDVIHLHNLHGYYLNIEILFTYLQRFKGRVIWTFHDCWPITGHCTNFTAIRCTKWKNGCYECPQLDQYPRSLFWDRSKKNFSVKKELFRNVRNLTIITPSCWLADIVRDSFMGDYDVQVINNGIDTEHFRPTESSIAKKYGLENKSIILGVANVWNARKGIQDFIELSKYISDDQKIVLIGVGPKLKKTLPNNILGIQHTNTIQELVEWYSAADVLFNPTYEDNYPTINLEAQACGTPVISYRTGGSPESIPVENVIDVGDWKRLLHMDYGKLRISNVLTSKSEMVNQYLRLYREK